MYAILKNKRWCGRLTKHQIFVLVSFMKYFFVILNPVPSGALLSTKWLSYLLNSITKQKLFIGWLIFFSLFKCALQNQSLKVHFNGWEYFCWIFYGKLGSKAARFKLQTLRFPAWRHDHSTTSTPINGYQFLKPFNQNPLRVPHCAIL